MESMKKSLPYIAIISVVLIWGFAYLAIKNSLEYCTPGFLIFARSSIASVILFFVCIKRFKKINKKDLLLSLFTGVCVSIGYILQTNGLEYETTAMVSFLENIYLVIVPFITWLITKKCPSIPSFIAAFLAIIGVILISIPTGVFSSPSNAIGVILCIAAGVAFGINISFSGSLQREKDPILYTFFQMVVLMVVSLAYTLISERTLPTINPRFVVNILYVAIPSTAIAWLLRNYAQNNLSSITMSIILPFASVLATIVSIVIGETKIDPFFIIGCVVLLVAALFESIIEVILNKLKEKGA